MDQFVKKDLMPPYRLALYFGGAAAVGMLFTYLSSEDPSSVWLIGISCLLLFSIVNNGMSFFAESYKYYLRNSLYSFIALLGGILGMGYLCTGASIQATDSYKVIMTVVLMANFVFIGMILFVKGLLNMLGAKDGRL